MTAKQKHPCYPRRRFKTEESAKAASRFSNAGGGIHRLPFACGKCNGWHLGIGNKSANNGSSMLRPECENRRYKIAEDKPL